MQKFKHFTNRKARKARRELGIVKRLLERHDMRVKEFLDDDEDPYLFVFAPKGGLSFDGIRIYKAGDEVAYRVQKEQATHPYGRAYPLPVEDMYNDALADHRNEEKAGREVMRTVAEDIQKFFAKSERAEREIRATGIDQSGDIAIKSTGTDYSNQIYSKG